MKKLIIISLILCFAFTCACKSGKLKTDSSLSCSSVSSMPEKENVSSKAPVSSKSAQSENAQSKKSISIVYSYKTGTLTVYGVTDSKRKEICRSVAFCGINGVTDTKKEGDKCTPTGTFDICRCFGIKNPPAELDSYIKITDSIYWVDDPESRYYNCCVDLNKVEKDWSSAEHMIDYKTQYAYGLIVEYNTNPVVKGNGSAIFIHCGTKKTAGCIAVPEETVITLIKLLKDYNKLTVTIE